MNGSPDEWVEIEWDEALDRVADGLATAVTRHGRNAVGVYLGNPHAHALGSATHGLPLVKALGTATASVRRRSTRSPTSWSRGSSTATS